MSDKLNEIKGALSKVTPGPWFTGKRGGQCHINHAHGNGDCVYDLVLSHSDDWVETTSEDHEIFEYYYEGCSIRRAEDAHLIANAPEYIAYLIQLVEEQRKTIGFYADKQNWELPSFGRGHSAAVSDRGYLARQALGKEQNP